MKLESRQVFIIIALLVAVLGLTYYLSGASHPYCRVIDNNLASPALRLPLNNYNRLKEVYWTIYKPTYKDIELRAYEIHQLRGGKAEDNWLEAERELTIQAKVYVMNITETPHTNLYEEALRISHEEAIRQSIEVIRNSGYLSDYLKGLGKTREEI